MPVTAQLFLSVKHFEIFMDDLKAFLCTVFIFSLMQLLQYHANSQQTPPDFKSLFDTLSMVLEGSSLYQNGCKHLVYNVSKFHKDCFSPFGEMRWF